MKKYTVAVIPGDGIGNEVMVEGLRILERVAELHGGISFTYRQYEWGCEYYTRTGAMMAEDGMDRLRDADAILLGAVGYPGVPDHISLRDLLLRIRQGFNQYVNLRPIKLITEEDCPLKGMGPADIDMIFVRENTEGEYAGVGGITREGTAEEMALQTSIFTRKNTEKVMDYAFNLARERLDARREAGRKSVGKVTSATKSNALNYGMVFWDKLFAERSKLFPDINTDQYHVDALSMYMLQRPADFDVVVASNLFGDILTDLGSVLQGGIGFAAGGNINPDRVFPSMFEPVHGSAPDIAWKGLANPIAMIWTVKMMLDFLGHTDLGMRVFEAIRHVVRERRGELTADMGGNGSTSHSADLILEAMGH